MDPFTLALINLGAAFGIIGVGVALLAAPIRVTRALNDWFAIVPAVAAQQRFRVAVVRLCGASLVFLGLIFAGRAITFAGRLL
jgi:hypothetical protein